MFGFGPWEVLLVVALIVLFFGGKKLPELAKGLGASIRSFKGELQKPTEIDAGDDAEDQRTLKE